MIANKSLRNRASAIIFVVSGTMWALMFFGIGSHGISHCIEPVSTMTTGPQGIPVCISSPKLINGSSPASFTTLLAMNPILPLMKGWGIMMLAMMLPVLIPPIHYLLGCSLKRKRLTSSLLFLLGYFTIWMFAGFVIVVFSILIKLFAPSPFLVPVILGTIALIWECSPVKQRCLNRNHHHPTLSAFGWSANRDALFFGFEHGFWCVASCWALMWWPMSLVGGHNLAMVAVTVFMVSSHLEHPKRPIWEFRLQPKLIRILIARLPIRKWAKQSSAV